MDQIISLFLEMGTRRVSRVCVCVYARYVASCNRVYSHFYPKLWISSFHEPPILFALILLSSHRMLQCYTTLRPSTLKSPVYLCSVVCASIVVIVVVVVVLVDDVDRSFVFLLIYFHLCSSLHSMFVYG